MMEFLLVLILFNLPFLISDYENDINNDFSNEVDKNLKISGISEKIYINNNWSEAKAAGICTGSGTYVDPYVIENITINGQGLGSCIEIVNSTAYFIIKNCTIYNAGAETYNAGIFLDKTDNGIILDNNCSNNNRDGYYLLYSGNNTLSGNLAYNNSRNGYSLGGGVNNTLAGNIANNNSNRGYFLGGGGNNTLVGNIANNNSQGFYLSGGGNNTLLGNEMNLGGIDVYGSINEMTSHKIDNSNLLNNKPIYYYGNEIGLKPNDFLNASQIILINCNNSLISGVNISDCFNGIYLNYGNNNTIEDNIVNNNINNGIEIVNSFNNNLTNNIANFNSKSGIYFSCNNNTLWNNTANNNQEYGIYVWGDSNFFIENEANFNNQYGIKIEGDNNTILDNHAFNNNEWGIYMIGKYNNASRNSMKNCGIVAAGHPSWRSTCSVDTSNTVNEKPVYFYNNEIGLNSYNFSNAGQVQLGNCNNSIISNLNISNTTIGINIFFGNNNTISGNIANNNNYFGLVFNGDNNNITGNIMNNNEAEGILIGGDNNTISGNILNNNTYDGLEVQGDNNQFIGNTICYNNLNGIFLMGSNCFFSENNISKNGEIGIFFSSSFNNLFYSNILYDNGLNAQDNGINNKWDNGIVGNYWGDYNGTDLNDDGIGDSPYNISGFANSQDNFPILDIDPPQIIISYPSSYATFGSDAPDFSVEIIEPHIDKMWYTINNGVTRIIFTLNGTINQALWDTAPEGNVVIKFYANDSVGNIGFQEVTVVKDITQPSSPEIPGYDLLFLVGIISVMVVMIIKKRVNYLTPT